MNPLLDVRNLKKYFLVRRGFFQNREGEVRAVDGVSFTLRAGETLGLVGESGCGKSTTALLILRLLNATAGEIYFENIPVFKASREQLRQLRRKMQIIFQDPYSSLNPRLTVEQIVGEGMEIHSLAKGKEKQERIAELLNKVGLEPGQMGRYPREYSGGQRQRIGIARALAVSPSFIVADEPVSSLDVSIQAQVINLLKKLQQEFHLTYFFISHDLRVIEHISDRVAVMYFGKLVELADTADLFRKPLHPYTEALLSAVPVPDPEAKRFRIILPGDPPSSVSPPTGCPLHPRCPKRFERCFIEEPPLREVEPHHRVACHLY